jgi:hypothetical protein
MKRLLLELSVVMLMSSCVTRSHLVEINDPYKEIKGIRLMQNVNGRSADKAASINVSQYYSISYAYTFEIKEGNQLVLSLDIQMQTPIRTDEFDSVMFLNLDNEKIRFVATDYKFKKFNKSFNTTSSLSSPAACAERELTTENGSYQLMSHQFPVPENLWVSLAYTAKKIKYRLYIGKEGIDVKLNPAETKKLKEFFSQAIKRRNESHPAIPEGQKK